MRRPGSLLGQIIVTLVCLVLGVVFTFILGLPMYRRAEASKSWPTADGRIQTSSVEQELDKGKYKYRSSVNFAYDVAGNNYESAYVWPSGGYSSSSKGEHQKVVDRYPAGSAVKVFYDPAKPEFGVLEPGVTTINYVLLGVGIVFFGVGLIMTLATGWRILMFGRTL